MTSYLERGICRVLIIFIRAYQVAVSPLLGPSCRFYPSCSHYAMEALDKHGGLKGCYLIFCRMIRCHPFTEGGVDPVPPKHHCEKLNQTCKN
jgi:putative membrane protein insertion efficiency factor